MQKQEQNRDPELWGGIECTINRVQHQYFDQLDYSGHYSRPQDIALLAGTGIQKIRYPILWEKHQPEMDSEIDWSWVSSRLLELRSRNIDVIAGFVHHGSGPAFTNLLDEQFPAHLAAYAAKVIRQFPHLTDFTPVNEPLTTARFSGLYGLWYPHQSDDHSFLKMLLNELKGTVLAMKEIRKVNPAARLVQTEDLGKTYSTKPLQYQANFENERRWLTYDLLCGRVNRDHPLWKYLRRNKITEKELAFFQENTCVPDVFGFNHYLTSERFLDGRLHRYPKHTHGGNGRHVYADVEAVRIKLKEESGLGTLLQEAWERYHQPMAVTEVHLHCHREEQLRWFRQVWSTCRDLLAKGVDIKGVTAWAMLGSFGWNKLLTEPQGDYEPGTFDVRSGSPRPTALARFLKERKGDAAQDELAMGNGWWQRSSRFFHRPLLVQQHHETVPPTGSPLLIIGKNGTLGRAFARVCDERHLPYRLLSRADCDLCDPDSINDAIEKFRPWAIVNASGFVRVDDAESEKEKCFADNTTAPSNLAHAAARYGIKLATFSSDLVFDGRKMAPYTEDDQPNPLNTYGLTKARAEELVTGANAAALVIRTSAFFGPWDEYNFAHFVRKSLLNEESINVVHDTLISPTYVPDLVHATLDLLMDGEKGIWHLSNNGEISWADLANEVADRFGLNRKFIHTISNEECHYPASRPRYSVLTSHRGILLPSLDDALRRYTEQMKDAVQKEKQQRKSVRA